jgi:hypothetical protein
MTLETDAHIFSDVTVENVAAVYDDFANYKEYFNGTRYKMTAEVLQKTKDGTLVNFTTTTISGLIKIKSFFQALVKDLSDRPFEKKITLTQLDNSNKTVRNLYATRYAVKVNIGGKDYTYVRIYTAEDIQKSIIPAEWIKKGSVPISIESIELTIAAAKTTEERTFQLLSKNSLNS